MLTLETHKKLIRLADAHQKADEYRSGHYDWNGGACAIGCTIRDATKLKLLPQGSDPGNHKAIGEVLGCGEYIMIMTDKIFEGLPDEDRPAWTPRLLRAIKPGRDYSSVPTKMAIYFLMDSEIGLANIAIREDVRKAAASIAELYSRRLNGDEPSGKDWDAVWQQAYAVWRQAYAVWRQADAARQQAYAVWQQAYAVWQQAYAVWRQADALWRQADAVWRQADALWQQADAARQQAYAVWRQFWLKVSKKLLEFIEASPKAA